MQSQKRVIQRLKRTSLVGFLCLTLLASPAGVLRVQAADSASVGWAAPGAAWTDTATDAIKIDKMEESPSTRERIEIFTAQDLAALSKNCRLDSWSMDKDVYLMRDLDLTDKVVEPIPVFNGTFYGQEHTISGLCYEGDGYVTGLFRYVGANGVLQNLNVQAQISSSGEKECVGGIVGINYGILSRCSFEGTVDGKNLTGGIVGINESCGQLYNCVVRGRVTGSYSTGGVVGKNYGQIHQCYNYAGVNDDTSWVVEDDEQRPELLTTMQTNDSKVMLYSGVDTGGIAGYSNGYIASCINYGHIGYEHTGYNIGGIVGRQCGIVEQSTNFGGINGRKDVGGIVGQMEPYVELNERDSLRAEVDKLHDMINTTINDIQASGQTIHSDLDVLQKYCDDTVDTGDKLAESLTDFADRNLESADQIMIRIEYVMDRLPAFFNDTDEAENSIKALTASIRQIGNDLALSNRLSSGDQERVDDALSSLSEDAEKLEERSRVLKTQLDELSSILEDSSLSYAEMEEALRAELPDLLETLGDMSNTSSSIASSLSTLLAIYAPLFADATGDANKDLERATGNAQDVLQALQNAMDVLEGCVNYLNAQEDIRFSKLGEDFDQTRIQLRDELKAINACVSNLTDHAAGYSDQIMNDLRAVNDQANLVLDLLLEHLEGLGEADTTYLYEDVSEQELEEATDGCVAKCTNKGVVNGDINVGGIAGAMSIDEEDPEENAAGTTSVLAGNRYTTKCVVKASTNEGFITAKKDGAGGICGFMKSGFLMDCEGYGSVESTEGDYVGGICGEALSGIKRCYAISDVQGGDKVGGIAGYADRIADCYSMSNILRSSGRSGSIAGQISSYEPEPDADARKVYGNYFVSDTLYGIDGINYSGVAEPLPYEELLTVEALPSAFRHLKVTFRTEDKILGSMELHYGDSLANLSYPDIPEKEGFYGVWPDMSGSLMTGNRVLTVKYVENVPVVADTGEHMEEKPYALVEQVFTQSTRLHVTKQDNFSPAPPASRDFCIYEVSLEGSELGAEDSTRLRLFCPYADVIVYEYADGTWRICESKVRGQYVQTTLTGDHGIFCVAVPEKDYTKWIIGGCAGGALLICILLIRLIKKKRARKQQKNAPLPE